ncbi:hypothetical protein BD779DRAFT_1476839 [Infundibulicybe gibba]|nr:hypothetical protein BD779DRAFT_1476839 [Infundibulicybe gibba]
MEGGHASGGKGRGALVRMRECKRSRSLGRQVHESSEKCRDRKSWFQAGVRKENDSSSNGSPSDNRAQTPAVAGIILQDIGSKWTVLEGIQVFGWSFVLVGSPEMIIRRMLALCSGDWKPGGAPISRDDTQAKVYLEVPGTKIWDPRPGDHLLAETSIRKQQQYCCHAATTDKTPDRDNKLEARRLNTTELMMGKPNQARKKAKSRRKRSKKVAQSNLATMPDSDDSELLEQMWVDIGTLKADMEAWIEGLREDVKRLGAEYALLRAEFDEMKVGLAALVGDRPAIHAIRRGVLLDMGCNRVATVCAYADWDSWLAASGDDRGQMYRQASAALAQVPLPRHWTDEALERLVSHHEPPRSLGYTIPCANRLNIEDSVLALPEGGQERKDMIAIFELIVYDISIKDLYHNNHGGRPTGGSFTGAVLFDDPGRRWGASCLTDLGLTMRLRESLFLYISDWCGRGISGSGRRVKGTARPSTEALWNDHERRRRVSLMTLRRRSPEGGAAKAQMDRSGAGREVGGADIAGSSAAESNSVNNDGGTGSVGIWQRTRDQFFYEGEKRKLSRVFPLTRGNGHRSTLLLGSGNWKAGDEVDASIIDGAGFINSPHSPEILSAVIPDISPRTSTTFPTLASASQIGADSSASGSTASAFSDNSSSSLPRWVLLAHSVAGWRKNFHALGAGVKLYEDAGEENGVDDLRFRPYVRAFVRMNVPFLREV